MKGHSERVPNKNLKNFNGKPLFHAVLKSLLAVPSIIKVLINTDSWDIADSALSNFNNIEIIERPSILCGDMVPMNDIIAYDIEKSEDLHFLQTHSTNPLLKPFTIEKAIATYFKNLENHDSVFSVTRWHTRLYWQDGSPVNHKPEELLRTQDLPPVFEENSNFYIFSKSSFKNSGNKRIGRTPFMFEMDKLEALDIDEPEDFKLAESLYRERI